MLLINETLSSIDAEASELVGIGVAVAAPVATSDHTIAIPGILPGWDGVDITAPLRTAFNVPVYVDNDANFAAYGESRMGVAAGKRNFVYISANDGVGAGIVINGEIMHGVTGMAGEIGHIRSTRWVPSVRAVTAAALTPSWRKTGWCSCSASHTAI